MADLDLTKLREIAEPPTCPNHREVQHRDRKPPWCPDCGWNQGRPAVPPRQIDTRWTPPPAPLTVGDLIDTEEEAASLPVGTIVRRVNYLPREKTSDNSWGNGYDNKPNARMAGENFIVAYLPPEGDEA